MRKGKHFLLRFAGLALRLVNRGQEVMNAWLGRAILLSQEKIGQRIVLFPSRMSVRARRGDCSGLPEERLRFLIHAQLEITHA
jgi:hypothetical protein